MDVPARRRVLYRVGVGLLLTFELIVCVYSQDADSGDVWFSLKNTTYSNNSLVIVEDIGSSIKDSLLCVTNLTGCCKGSGANSRTLLGNWYFPNETKVPSETVNATLGEQWDFYRTRGHMVVRMHRKRGGVEGIYRCEITDSLNVTQTIYIGVYNTSNGLPSVTSLTYNGQSATLTCTSTGGPATTVTWRRDGVVITINATHQQTKRVVDPVNGTYQTVLIIDPSVGLIEGTYSCMVKNDVGNSSETVVLKGAGDVWFSLNNATYQNNSWVALEDIGSSNEDSLLCKTNLTACCRKRDSSTPLGNWFFPNGTKVGDENNGLDFYRARGHMVVRLNRKRGGVEGIYRCEIPDSMNVIQTIYIGVYNTSNEETTFATSLQTVTPTETDSAMNPTGTVPVSSIQPTNNPPSDGTTTTTGTVLVSSIMQSTTTERATTMIKTVPVSSSIKPTNSLPSDGATPTSVIIVVAVVIILVVIVVGVVILVVLFRAKKRKQQLEIKQSVTKDIEMKLKQEDTTIKKASSSDDVPPYSVIKTVAPPDVPPKSEELVEFLNENSTLTTGYSEIRLESDDNKHILPSKPPRKVDISDSMFEEMESSPAYQNMDQHCDSKSIMNVPEGNDIYTEPDTTISHTFQTESAIYEVVYSEPIQPLLFTDVVGSVSGCEDLQHYGPVYTISTSLTKSKEVILKVFGDNIQEICELGMGQFGKVILAETVGLSAKDLRLSESDDDKSKSTLVAVKKLKSDAPNTTKEGFEKEVNFMSRLTDRNVIRILGVCHEDTPFIMMEYMEKGDLNQYLQKFRTLSTTDSEPQGQITINTLVNMTTQIVSAMKYLTSHNYVHRDLATRNCLVGPNYLVKISDFGMSRSLYDSHYYRIHGRFVLPVRWMAYECFYGKFSQKSDVWAFGVTMWEIFSLAKEQPYNDMSDEQIIEDALKGKNRKIMAKSEMCPLEVYEIMLKCWSHNSNQRATFDELFQLLTSIDVDE